jgi:putative FmdB family regulatory protein
MPTYEYTCDACRHEFECEQRIVDPPLKKCPRCGKKKVRRLVSSGNFILKGSGWYADSYGLHTGKGASQSSSKVSGNGSVKSDDKSPTNGGNGPSDKPADKASASSESSGGKKESGKSSKQGSASTAHASS